MTVLGLVLLTATGIPLILGFAAYVVAALKPPSPKKPSGFCPRVKLSDGRHLAYEERGVPKDKANHHIIVAHAFADSRHFHFPISQDLLEELKIYILSFDRAGYGESDPHPKRSVKTEALDIQELANKLQIGPKFHVIGISLGAYAIYGCLEYIPHRLLGAALISPLANVWWRCIPTKISGKALRGLPAQDRWIHRVAHYAPWLLHWWMTQKWLPSLSAFEGKTDAFSPSDEEILKALIGTQQQGLPGQGKEQIINVHESYHRDLMVGFGKWEFEPTDIVDPFPNKKGRVHIWQGNEDKVFPSALNRCISQQLPWIEYHEVANAGHLMIYNETHCEAIFRTLVSS